MKDHSEALYNNPRLYGWNVMSCASAEIRKTRTKGIPCTYHHYSLKVGTKVRRILLGKKIASVFSDQLLRTNVFQCFAT